MEWLVIDEKYLDYLRNIDSRIPYSDYGINKYKTFFGVFISDRIFYYVTQIVHAQKRHEKIKANLDLKKFITQKSKV